MSVSFADAAEKGELSRSISSTELQKFNSAAPTLQNTPTATPQRSRAPSLERRKIGDMGGVEVSPSQSTVVDTADRYTNHELAIGWMSIVIIASFFTSGCIDAVAFNSWNCFVGMQTGNTVFAALGIGGQPTAAHNRQYLKSLVSIAAFCVGVLFYNFIHRWPTGIHKQPTSRRRVIFVLSFLLQTIFIFTAAALVHTGVVSNQPFVSGTFSSGSDSGDMIDYELVNYIDMVPIALLAFASAGQVCLSRVLSVIELPTIVLSTLFHDFTADTYNTRQLWRNSSSVKDFILVQAWRQERRFLAIVSLFAGALVGGEMYKSSTGMAGALWLSGFIKGAITIAFALWRKQKPEVNDNSA